MNSKLTKCARKRCVERSVERGEWDGGGGIRWGIAGTQAGI